MPLCGVRVGKRREKQLCNPLDADQGAPHSRREPADWLGVGARDRHVAVLVQPARVSLETEWRCCRTRKWGRCWSHHGKACCRGRGKVVFPRTVLNRWSFLGTGSTAACQTRRQGRSPPPRPPLQHWRWISCTSDPGFLTEEEEGGGVEGLRGVC